ncbi:hypothetical protein KQI38_13900 [Tissierella carlieri]|uniref:hypothetical protein n=1 Tax=Tissierella carlieri TaxID=689904 RepID=UPI001C11EABC|nr:hypothetical protein [Tissierella carlieri]MBU5313133.1 hypothetical protein [Tissierella carlieri]
MKKLRAFMNNRKLIILNQIELAFIDAKVWNRVFGEGVKHTAYHVQRQANIVTLESLL